MFARGQDAEHAGLTPGFLEGTRHQRLVRGRAPRHRGVLVGSVAAVDARSGAVTVRLQVRTLMLSISQDTMRPEFQQ